MKSTSDHNFAQLGKHSIPRSSFDRSHGLKTTFDSGKLIPMFVDEVLPGDTFNLNTSAFARLATPINPVMDNMHLETFYFFVPTRLVWDNHAKFMGERKNPGDSIDYLIPTDGASGDFDETSVADYMGIPTLVNDQNINVLPIRAYGLIWNEWFRDENLQDSLDITTDDTSGTGVNWRNAGGSLPRGKRHDYFTSCLPSPQKGDAIQLPLGDRANILGLAVTGGETTVTGAINMRETGSTEIQTYTNSYKVDPDPSAGEARLFVETVGSGTNQYPDIYADLTAATTSSINDFRQALAAQEFLERDMRGGTRYTSLIQSHFGVTSPDARLQRPEYLGGGSTAININPVAQTSSTDATTPQGNLSAFGTGSFSNHGFTKSFTEHGYIIGLVNVRADLTYQQGLNKLWSRQSRLDFYWPEFAHLGEQAVLNKEIYSQGNSADDDVFGYQERWAEYRYKPSIITGAFRSNAATPLDSWHLAQDFDTLPALNATFIEDNPPIDRIIAVPSEPQFIMDMYFSLKCARTMPTYSIPGLNTTRF